MTTKWKHQDKLGWQALCDIDTVRGDNSLKSASEHMEHAQYICFVIESLDNRIRELNKVITLTSVLSIISVAIIVLLLTNIILFKG